MDIRSLSTDDLLRGTEDRVQRRERQVSNWLDSQGIVPGSKRIYAPELYQMYVDWCREHGVNEGETQHFKWWGRVLTAKLPKGKTNRGVYYLVDGIF